jgi:hypothetical protein
MSLLQINSYDELLLMHLMMMEAKFHDNPNNVTLQGSHRVADLAENIIYALMAAEAQGEIPGDPPNWQHWRAFSENHREYTWVINKLKTDKFWQLLNEAQSLQYVKDLISPFSATNEQLAAVILEASR